MKPIATSSQLPLSEDTQHVNWSSNRRSPKGVGYTQPDKPRIASQGFSTCSALLIESLDRPHETTLLHLFPNVITQAQVEELARLKEQGGDYRARLICKKSVDASNDPERGNDKVIGAEEPLVQETGTVRMVINKRLPSITWEDTLKLPYKCWSMAYDVSSHKLHIRDEATERCYDYGDPFSSSPRANIHTDDATHEGPEKGIRR